MQESETSEDLQEGTGSWQLECLRQKLAAQVPQTSFGVPYLEFTASEATLEQVATFRGGKLCNTYKAILDS